MKITISAIGKMKSGPEQELFARYLKRANGMCPQLGFPTISLKEYPESRNTNVLVRKQQESAQLCTTVKGGDVIFILDERGKDFTSQKFSELLAARRDSGTSSLFMMIGGPDGLDQELMDKASAKIRLGSMTWPHQLARILLIEQIYRSMTLLSGHPYHRQ